MDEPFRDVCTSRAQPVSHPEFYPPILPEYKNEYKNMFYFVNLSYFENGSNRFQIIK